MFERFSSAPKVTIAEKFQKLSLEEGLSAQEQTFESLENTLLEHGFSLAGSIEAAEVIQSETLLCRSENFTKVLDLIESDTDLEINNADAWANMCTMSAGSGFKTAMLEGFSGKDVGGIVKVVISFSGEHLVSTASISKDNDLWKTKPETAAVSLAGQGVVTKDDLRMISFRFPVRFFPETHLSDEEKDRLEEEKINFIVRHYVPNENAAPSYRS